MLTDAAGILIAVTLFWVGVQFFGGRFSAYPHSGPQGCLAVAIGMLLLLAVYVFGIAP